MSLTQPLACEAVLALALLCLYVLVLRRVPSSASTSHATTHAASPRMHIHVTFAIVFVLVAFRFYERYLSAGNLVNSHSNQAVVSLHSRVAGMERDLRAHGLRMFVYDLPPNLTLDVQLKSTQNSHARNFEEAVHRLFRDSPLRTLDSSTANAFYIPFSPSSGLHSGAHSIALRSAARMRVLRVIEYMDDQHHDLWTRHGGSDHIWAFGNELSFCLDHNEDRIAQIYGHALDALESLESSSNTLRYEPSTVTSTAGAPKTNRHVALETAHLRLLHAMDGSIILTPFGETGHACSRGASVNHWHVGSSSRRDIVMPDLPSLPRQKQPPSPPALDAKDAEAWQPHYFFAGQTSLEILGDPWYANVMLYGPMEESAGRRVVPKGWDGVKGRFRGLDQSAFAELDRTRVFSRGVRQRLNATFYSTSRFAIRAKFGNAAEFAAEDARALDNFVMDTTLPRFCICARGFSAAAAARCVVDMALAGCVPIVVADRIELPFQDRIRWADTVVFVPESRIARLETAVESALLAEVDDTQQLHSTAAKHALLWREYRLRRQRLHAVLPWLDWSDNSTTGAGPAFAWPLLEQIADKIHQTTSRQHAR